MSGKMGINWREIPFMGLCLSLALGIILYPYLSATLSPFIALIFVFLTFLIAIFFKKIARKWVVLVQSILVYFCFVSLGYSLSYFKHFKNHHSHFGQANVEHLEVQLFEPLEEKNKTYKAVVKITKGFRQKEYAKASGKAILYIDKNIQSIEKLNYGDIFFIKNKLKSLEFKHLPGTFNYKLFLERKGITHQAYITKSDIILTDKNNGNPVISSAFFIRNNIILNLEKYLKPNDLAFAKGLMFGDKSDIRPEVLNDFQKTGTAHILAVSGLHTGILFLVLSSVLFFLKNSGKSLYLKTFLILLGLWFFALLTGFSASVSRAALMFSVIQLAKCLKRHTYIFNTIAFSAFVLMVSNPNVIYDVGFQLSYAAVLSIVTFYPKFKELFQPSDWMLDKVWSLAAVSIAAQLGTFPLSLYYFHSFANSFLISNLLIIPYIGIMLILLINLAIFSFIPFLAKPLAWIFSAYSSWIQKVADFISHLSFSSINEIYIHKIQLIILLAFIVFMGYYLYHYSQKRMAHLNYLMLFAILYMSVVLYNQRQRQKQSDFFAINSNGHYTFVNLQGENAQLISNQLDSNVLNYQLKPYLLNKGIKDWKYKNTEFFKFQNLNFYMPTNKKMKLINAKDSATYFINQSHYRLAYRLKNHSLENKQIVFHSADKYFNKLKKYYHQDSIRMIKAEFLWRP